MFSSDVDLTNELKACLVLSEHSACVSDCVCDCVVRLCSHRVMLEYIYVFHYVFRVLANDRMGRTRVLIQDRGQQVKDVLTCQNGELVK